MVRQLDYEQLKMNVAKTFVFACPSDSQALIHWKTKLRSAGGRRQSTTTRSGGSRKTIVIICMFEGMYGFPRGIQRWTVNLYNNNIYSYIYKNIKHSAAAAATTTIYFGWIRAWMLRLIWWNALEELAGSHLSPGSGASGAAENNDVTKLLRLRRLRSEHVFQLSPSICCTVVFELLFF